MPLPCCGELGLLDPIPAVALQLGLVGLVRGVFGIRHGGQLLLAGEPVGGPLFWRAVEALAAVADFNLHFSGVELESLGRPIHQPSAPH